jgi:hypothetical protein
MFRASTVFRKVVPLAFLITGIVVVAVSFLYYAGNALPYPDPTAELLDNQTAEAKKWSMLFMFGLLATVTGGAWLLWRSRVMRPGKDS